MLFEAADLLILGLDITLQERGAQLFESLLYDLASICLPMPVSPSGVSWISARHFWNCLSFDEL